MADDEDTRRAAIHTSNAFLDAEATALVSRLIARTHRAMPDIRANDKWPNLDGFVELVDDAGAPLGKLQVQVKKLGDASIASRSYSFSDDKFLAYASQAVDETVLLIGADIGGNRAFWVHVDDSLVRSLAQSPTVSGRRTVRFPPGQELTESETGFIAHWRSLVDARRAKLSDYDRLKAAYTELTRLGSPAFGKSGEQFVRIHEFLDAYNALIETDFEIVRRHYYPGAWKVGMAYHRFEPTELSFGLFPIPIDANDVAIRELPQSPMGRLQALNLPTEGWTAHLSANPISADPKAHARQLVYEKVRRILDQRGLIHAVHPTLAAEYIFAYVDRHAASLGFNAGSSLSIDSARRAFFGYLPIWLDEAVKDIVSRQGPGLKPEWMLGHDGFQRQPWFDLSSIRTFLIPEDEKRIHDAVERRIRDGRTQTASHPIHDLRLPPRIFVEMLEYCGRTGIATIHRPFAKHEHTGGNGWVWGVWTPRQLRDAISRGYGEFPSVYDALVTANFPRLAGSLVPTRPHVVLLALRGEFSNERVGPAEPHVTEVRLRDNKSAPPASPDIIVLQGPEAEEAHARYWATDARPVINGVEYEVEHVISRGFDDLYDSTPLMHMCYIELARRLASLDEGHSTFWNFHYRA